jgi:serpin B
MYLELCKTDKNFVFSPYSIRDCFSILYSGVTGKTREEFEKVLSLNTNICDKLQSNDKGLDESVLVANKVYVNKDCNLNTSSLSCKQIEAVDMSPLVVQRVNSYVADVTKNNIQNLLSDSSVSSETAMILVNALYFLKKWRYKSHNVNWFTGVEKKGFTGKVNVFRVKEIGNIDVLRLVYVQDSVNWNEHIYSMYILADSNDSKDFAVDEFVSNLSVSEFESILDFTDYSGLQGYDEVNFVVPSFELNYKSSLNNLLKALGLNECFTLNNTDFASIGDIHIDDVIHASRIKVNESGTEASAATAIVSIKNMCMVKPTKKKQVYVDSPFMFVVKDDTINEIMFMGRVSEL